MKKIKNVNYNKIFMLNKEIDNYIKEHEAEIKETIKKTPKKETEFVEAFFINKNTAITLNIIDKKLSAILDYVEFDEDGICNVAEAYDYYVECEYSAYFFVPELLEDNDIYPSCTTTSEGDERILCFSRWRHIEDFNGKGLDKKFCAKDLNVGDEISCEISYPLTTPCNFKLIWNGDVNDLMLQYCNKYKEIYKEEDESMTVDPSPNGLCLNRGFSNGKWGIWGHVIGDLNFQDVTINVKTKTLSVNINS